jgi:transcriptional regulator with XRE-family HTH domain
VVDADDPAPSGGGPLGAFGRYLRTQRELAQLSLRQLAELTRISNPYLSQIERGLHQPSVAVIKALAQALNLSAEELLAQAAGLDGTPGKRQSVESAVRTYERLSASQKRALIAVYRSMVEASEVPAQGASVPGTSSDDLA